MQICARPQMMSLRYSMDEIIPMFRAAGFDGYEFCIEDKLFHVRPDLIEPYVAKHISQVTRENELVISAIGCHVDFVADDDVLAVIEKGITRTRLFDTDLFIVATGARDDTADGGYGRLLERLAHLLRIAADHGVRIALEPEPDHRVDTTASFLQLLADLDNHPALHCNFDIGHSHLLDPDIYTAIEQVGARMAHAHIENMGRVHRHLLPWEGEIDLLRVLQKMREIGFAGGMAFDFYNQAYQQEMPRVAAYLRGLVDALNGDGQKAVAQP